MFHLHELRPFQLISTKDHPYRERDRKHQEALKSTCGTWGDFMQRLHLSMDSDDGAPPLLR